MKKLMIAAAAAAMIGGAEAMTYDFSASLKTTKGKYQGATEKCNLGADSQGAASTFWYDDEEVGPITEVFDAKTKKSLGFYSDMSDDQGNTVVQAIKWSTNKQGYIGKLNKSAMNAADDWTKAALAAYYGPKYNYKSAGKWCDTFSYKVGGCYRVAGSRKVTSKFHLTNCCDDTDAPTVGGATLWTAALVGEQYTAGNKTKDVLGKNDIELVDMNAVYFRFGGATFAKSTKVEFMGQIGSALFDAGTFALAGQGTWSAKLGKDDTGATLAGIKSISGNIVGALETSYCESCCQYPIPSIGFYCDGTEFAPWYDGTQWNDLVPTAAYGTFSLKFNATISKDSSY